MGNLSYSNGDPRLTEPGGQLDEGLANRSAHEADLRVGVGGDTIQPMNVAWLAPTLAVAVAVGLAAPAHADPDTDFDNQVRHYGIYGPHDYNPYLGKIACRRLSQGVDPDAAASADFLAKNLPRGTTRVQTFQFLGTAITVYCPDQAPKLQNIPAR
jgi:hypothetical protein